ncbi:tonB-dependent Receptor Plug domain protein [Escherichia coli 99.1805]|nr:tonB-dependent Receptor Plug domain protein [Escherichia coli 99.1805]EZD77590.1 colicin I receptor [Escherichia coli O157:NM str. 08-4540]
MTTNRSASNLWESPATIQVIDQQTLQNSTNASIADNLQDIPGVEITDNSLAGRKQIRIRGEASSRVLILIDGQEVTYQRAGDNYGVGLLIDESALERVEVVKGPYSVLYGSVRIMGENFSMVRYQQPGPGGLQETRFCPGQPRNKIQ